MTIRAVLLGLLGAVFVCVFTYVNDAMMHQTMFIGNNMPLSVYGGLILVILLINPALRRWAPGLVFSGAELAVIVMLTLSAAAIPGSGLMRTFGASVMMPHKYVQTEAGWSANGVIEMTPDAMLADISENPDRALNGWLQGLAVGKHHISPAEVPWSAWVRPVGFWIPVVLLLWGGLGGLALMFHRQWADHEHLPYPIAQFANSLLPSAAGERSPVVRTRIFWIGLGAVLFIHLNNYAYEWFNDTLIRIPTFLDFVPLMPLFETLNRGGGWFAFRPALFFTVIAFAYFLAADVSLSMAIGPYLFCLVSGVAVSQGVSVSGGGMFSLKPVTFLNFGAYLGLFLVFLYTGRHYYWHTLRHAVRLPDAEKVDRSSVWGLRTFLVTTVTLVVMLTCVGLDWQLALVYVLLCSLVFVVMGRIIAETGCFMIQPTTYPSVLILGVLGAQALGPKTLLILFMLSCILMLDPREAFMPFMINNLKLAELRELPVGKVSRKFALAAVVGMAVCVPATLYFQYDRGANMSDVWATQNVPKAPFAEAVSVKQRLKAQGGLDEAESVSGFGRLGQMSPDWPSMKWLLAGLALVLVFSAGRLKFSKWPLHPVLFLVWGSYPGKMLAFSFFIGWLIKVLVTKYGGAKVYQNLKPLMIGLIAGDMLGGVIPSIIGFIYYVITKDPPRSFHILPG